MGPTVGLTVNVRLTVIFWVSSIWSQCGRVCSLLGENSVRGSVAAMLDGGVGGSIVLSWLWKWKSWAAALRACWMESGVRGGLLEGKGVGSEADPFPKGEWLSKTMLRAVVVRKLRWLLER